jgi:TIGR03009 family protein
MRGDRWHVLTLAVAALGIPSVEAMAQAPAPAAAAARAVAEDPMKPLLRAWEKQSARLETLDVEMKRVDNSPAWGDEEFIGRAILQRPNLAMLDFRKVQVDEKTKQRVAVADERIVCTGTEIWQYKSEGKQIFIFPIDRKNRDRSLEEGPLPFLFNMRAAEAEARYTMSLLNQTPAFYVISVVPKEKIDRDSFKKALIKLSKQNFLPEEIFLVGPDDKSTKRFILTKVSPNAKVNADNFKGKPLGPPWAIVRNPAGDANAGQAPVQRAAVPFRSGGPASAAPAGAVVPAGGRRVR